MAHTHSPVQLLTKLVNKKRKATPKNDAFTPTPPAIQNIMKPKLSSPYIVKSMYEKSKHSCFHNFNSV